MSSQPVSILIPALADVELFERNLPALQREIERRDGIDELIVIDDTGQDQLRAWFSKHYANARGVINEVNRGYASSLLAGAQAAKNELLLCLNPDVRVREGFLDPLVEKLADPHTFAVSPRVLLDGKEDQAESLQSLQLDDGLLRLEAHGPAQQTQELRPVPFAIGGAMLLRRADFLDGQGFDSLFAPFYWEDVDLCLRAWSEGKRVVEVPRSVVEHHHRGTIGRTVPEELVRAAIEKNRLLLTWKYLDDESQIQTHLARVWRDLIDDASSDQREGLLHLLLALDQLPELQQARDARGKVERSLEAVMRASSPL